MNILSISKAMLDFFKKKIKTDPSLVIRIAEAVKLVIGPQLTMSNRNADELLKTKFALGYLTGVCDALGQKLGVPDDQYVLVTGGVFAALFQLQPEAFAAVLKLDNDAEFSNGQTRGGQEACSFLAKQIPMASGLIDHWKPN